MCGHVFLWIVSCLHFTTVETSFPLGANNKNKDLRLRYFFQKRQEPSLGKCKFPYL